MVTNVRDFIYADSSALVALSINILFANITKARKVEYFHFDLTCHVISYLWVKLRTLFGKFTCRAIEWHLKFENRPSSLQITGGGDMPLLTEFVTRQTPIGRGLTRA